MKRATITVILAGLVLVISGTAVAEEFIFTLNGGAQFNTNDTYDIFSSDDQTTSANLAFGYEVIPNLRLALEYETSEEVDQLFESWDMSFAQHAMLASVEYSYPLLKWFRPHIRVGAGVFWGDIDLDIDGVAYDDTDVGFQLYAVGGYDLIWYLGDPDSPKANFFDHVGLGITNDYGWVQRTALTFDEILPVEGADPADDDDEPVAQQGPAQNMGSVDLYGWTWRLGFTVRYRF